MIKNESRLIGLLALATIVGIGLLSGYLGPRSAGSVMQPFLDSQDSLKAIANYRSWTKANPSPQLMHQKTANLCGIWIAPSGTNVHGETNPHHRKYITVYVNELGRKAMMEQLNPKFPQGSVIVKEKLSEVF